MGGGGTGVGELPPTGLSGGERLADAIDGDPFVGGNRLTGPTIAYAALDPLGTRLGEPSEEQGGDHQHGGQGGEQAGGGGHGTGGWSRGAPLGTPSS